MPIAARSTVTAAFTALAVGATLLGCSSGTPSGGMLPDGSGSGRDGSVTPLPTQVSARLGRVATASILVGSRACVTLTELAVHATPMMLAALRRHFHGTFTPPQAEITALADPTDTTALDALTFPDHGVAQANRAARRAAASEVSALAYGDPNEVRVTSSAVSGRVLSFELTASHPHDFPDRVVSNGLGVDICP